MVKSPSDMIAMGDSKPDATFDGNIDPTTTAEWPSNRHQKQTVLNFADGHSENALRKAVIPTINSGDVGGLATTSFIPITYGPSM
jgi:hypothetical protein